MASAQLTTTRRDPPSHFFWLVPKNFRSATPAYGYHCFDKILGELTCAACFYQTYSRKKMELHISQQHAQLNKVSEDNVGGIKEVKGVLDDLPNVEAAGNPKCNQ